jgi:hypothetical protein
MTDLTNDVRELSIDDLDMVIGGKGLLDTAVQIIKEAVQVVTSTSGACTNHWFSE